MSPDTAYIGQINLIGFKFAPRGWEFCLGQILPINDNQALFSLIGCEFGGDCRTNFGLPDLRARVPIGVGNRPGLTNYQIGQQVGAEQHVLSVSQMPAHTHEAKFTPSYSGGGSSSSPISAVATVHVVKGDDSAQVESPEGAYFAQAPGTGGDRAKPYSQSTPNATMAAGAITVNVSGGGGGGGMTGGTVEIGQTGESRPFPVVQPSLALNYCICLEGIYPPRS